ncbi:putative lipoprotein [Myxococcus hansupus]|uniref:Putative lipoprotein n=1 Tax=Pseudomyxococcus hansupus TaxID=1297742 RepID=A0A0H4X9W6_9BACT|nr:hypothetical protein [Myxococcus hansupus]AKQ63092.1 hypothetical protein A176_000004 [Myxococcus hansupus]AKQ70828.1 putative lipoprotein [Myxococcus hansupus]
MMRALLLLPCVLLLSACSAEIAIQTEPFDQVVPVTSLLEPVYAEVALDLPEESVNTQNLDIVVNEVAASLVVVNPSPTLTLRTAARLSLTGSATPDNPRLYTDFNRPAYYDTAAEILPQRDFQPNSRTPVRIDAPALKSAIGRRRVWVIVSNTVVRSGLTLPQLPAQIRLEDIVFQALLTKPFPGLGGALEVGGL